MTNLKGGTDSLFFIYDDDHLGSGPEDLAMISLNRYLDLRPLYTARGPGLGLESSQLMGRNCSCLLPKRDVGISQINPTNVCKQMGHPVSILA